MLLKLKETNSCSRCCCCILIIHIQIYAETSLTVNDDFNERTNTLLYKNIPLTLYSRKGWCWLCVWEVSYHLSQVHSGPEWQHLIGSYLWVKRNKLRNYAKVNYLKLNCFDIKTLFMLNWIVLNGTFLVC